MMGIVPPDSRGQSGQKSAAAQQDTKSKEPANSAGKSTQTEKRSREKPEALNQRPKP